MSVLALALLVGCVSPTSVERTLEVDEKLTANKRAGEVRYRATVKTETKAEADGAVTGCKTKTKVDSRPKNGKVYAWSPVTVQADATCTVGVPLPWPLTLLID